ncbi:MAG: PorT family protein [Candidatus Aminicenantes bacterium]|nr:PorT family protein [Candidatus Aminicenantes bacterium]
MKTKIAALGMIVLGFAADGPAAPAVEPGIVLGLNMSRLSGPGLGVDWETKGGFTAGAVLTFSLTDFFALQPGLFYAQKGGLSEEPLANGKVRLALRLSHLDLPLIARLSAPTGPEAKFRPYLLGGASYSLKLSATLRTDLVDEYDMETTIDESPAEGLKSGGFNAVLGGGFEVTISNYRFLAEVRYSRGLSTLMADGSDLRQSVTSILFGFVF